MYHLFLSVLLINFINFFEKKLFILLIYSIVFQVHLEMISGLIIVLSSFCFLWVYFAFTFLISCSRSLNYLFEINNKVLLYNTKNNIQYSVINHNGKTYKNIYVCITKSLCCRAEIKQNNVNQLYFNKIFFKNYWLEIFPHF